MSHKPNKQSNNKIRINYLVIVRTDRALFHNIKINLVSLQYLTRKALWRLTNKVNDFW